eukprot:GHUV01057880.1.p1 GENE.GHUV01057880.1~~GHUV01057880.1.p1  ORF type:complete len:106 (-),score=19.55 GHUV01057880.1:7-324(-)
MCLQLVISHLAALKRTPFEITYLAKSTSRDDATVCVVGVMTDRIQALLSRGQAAVEAIASGTPDPSSRRDADAFQQLQLICQMMELAGQRQWDRLLQVCCTYSRS